MNQKTYFMKYFNYLYSFLAFVLLLTVNLHVMSMNHHKTEKLNLAYQKGLVEELKELIINQKIKVLTPQEIENLSFDAQNDFNPQDNIVIKLPNGQGIYGKIATVDKEIKIERVNITLASNRFININFEYKDIGKIPSAIIHKEPDRILGQNVSQKDLDSAKEVADSQNLSKDEIVAFKNRNEKWIYAAVNEILPSTKLVLRIGTRQYEAGDRKNIKKIS